VASDPTNTQQHRGVHDVSDSVVATLGTMEPTGPSAAVEALVRRLPAIMHGIDAEGRLVFVSPKWQSLLGYTSRECLGRPLIEFLSAESRETALQQTIPAFLKTGHILDVPLVMVAKDGTFRHVLLSAFTEPDDDGAFLHSLAFLVDVTEQQKANEALAQSEQQFRGSFDAAPHGMALMAPDGRWLAVNDMLCGIVGYGREELLETDFQTITHPDDLESDLDLLRQVLEGERTSYQMDKRYIRKDGSMVPILLSVSLVRDGSGAPVHFVSQIQDLPPQKHAESQLAKAQKLESVGQLTGGIAHDFNNLLTIVTGNLQLIEKACAGDDKMVRRWQAAMEACQRGADLTQRLLAFARRQPLAPVPTHAGQLIGGMHELLSRALGENIELETSGLADIPLVHIDPAQLESALLNLAINARDAMTDEMSGLEGGTLAIETSLADVEDPVQAALNDLEPGRFVRIAVSDTGRGIPDDLQDKVFEPFFSTKGAGGSGLGLSMVYGFVKQSGGHVNLYSEPGFGTTVTMYLPVEAADGSPSQLAPTAENRAVRGGNETILVVEDQVPVREVAVSVLRELGYRVLEAGNAADALAVLDRSDPIDLLFTDIVMPGEMNGYELASKAVGLKPGLKAVLTSGFAQSLSSRSEFGNAEHMPVLSKPYRSEALAHCVREQLDG